MDRRVEISKIIAGLAEYYDKLLSVTQLAMYVEDLLSVEPAKLREAILQYRNDPKNDRFPLPAKLKTLADPGADPESEAIEAASRIVQAVSRIGPYESERAKAFIGELGWLVVQREGGWVNVCQILTDENIGTLKAQWRQMAKAQYTRAKAGQVGAPPLPAPVGSNVIDLKNLLPDMPRGNAG